MKKISLLAAITASVFMLVSASVWEGAADIGGNLPENGLFIATNSFPIHTKVEVENLENSKKVTVVVSSSLDNSGLLALLSKDAADYIGLKNMSRIRMREKDDQVAYSGLEEGVYLSGDPNYNTGGNTDWNTENERMKGGGSFAGLDGYDLEMIAAEPRPPEDRKELDPDYFIPSIARPPETMPSEIYEPPVIAVIPSISQPAMPPPAVASSTTPLFSDYMIQSFEKGMYYVQIGAYKTTQTVESEILKVDKNLPVAVMKIESEDAPIYRVLIGPLNLGESGAVFQRYKAIYTDAVLRVGY